ncbi:MAG TPA: response regulator [Opitutaceae bacterium]|jgi:CheY-like chemotaxis protein|nr:response regulator [Opitutaceae bacterium]HRE06096.1 response regulator [Opitutaceae bacterium]
MRPTPQHGTILLVDDDPTSLMVLRVLVEQAKLPVQTARNGEEAIDYILGASPAKYEAVITDYLMPGINGITLLERIQQIDPSLATIIATSDAERNTVSSSLKMGAVDFLEKPISRTGLLAAIVRATNHTRRQRHLIGAENRLAAVASIQKRLAPRLVAANAQERTLDCELTTRACPINEAGGDFVTALRSDAGTVEVVLGDVSGHGVIEGFIAAYFQGMVKGMQTLGASPDQIALACNRFLLREWAQSGPDHLPSSLCAVFVTLDLNRSELTVLNYGCPAIRIFDRSGRSQLLAKQSSPLGWFEDLAPGMNRIAVSPHSCCYLWSDGLGDHARQVGVTPLALATRLLLSKPEQASSLFAAEGVRDDVLLARLRWFPSGTSEEDALPVFFEELRGNELPSIDALQGRLERDLTYALSQSAGTLHSLLLCVREAVINALLHGCEGRPDKTAELRVHYVAKARRVDVAVVDSGRGFTPPPRIDVPDLSGPGTHISLGCQLIYRLCPQVRYADGGTACHLSFELPLS